MLHYREKERTGKKKKGELQNRRGKLVELGMIITFIERTNKNWKGRVRDAALRKPDFQKPQAGELREKNG